MAKYWTRYQEDWQKQTVEHVVLTTRLLSVAKYLAWLDTKAGAPWRTRPSVKLQRPRLLVMIQEKRVIGDDTANCKQLHSCYEDLVVIQLVSPTCHGSALIWDALSSAWHSSHM